ncbi:hypothetical protein LJC31_08740, partial [Synergistaceae bacterium OttesenSCG-928-I11]|nr:hypothetical protein [Synergistaceae bacterium OttesenSCG-928-I11]
MFLLCLLSLFALTIASAGGASADVWDGTLATGFDGGNGNPGTPYLIATPGQLAYLADRVNNDNKNYENKHYKLTADIDLNGSMYDWTPIGDGSYLFRGTFDGDGHTISNMKVEASIKYAGLFGFIGSGGSVHDLALRDVDVQSDFSLPYVGGLAGRLASGGSIANVAATGRVETTEVGALAGGLVGFNMGTVTSCASSCAVESLGGTNPVFGTGGLVGSQQEGAITASLATGPVTAVGGANDVRVGGFAGTMTTYDDNTISDSLAAGRVAYSTTKTADVGGFIGMFAKGRLSDNVFDSQGTGQTAGIGNPQGNTDAEPMTTAALTAGTGVPFPL